MSKLSLHISGSPTSLSTLLSKCYQAKSPVSILYSVNQNVSEDIRLHSPSTKWIYRRQTETFNRLPNGFFTGDPVRSAQDWLLNTRDSSDRNRNQIENILLNKPDWADVLNEPAIEIANPDDPAQVNEAIRRAKWLNAWTIEALRITHTYNVKLVLFSFPTQSPPVDARIWDELVPSMKLGKQYGALLSLHCYGDPDGDNPPGYLSSLPDAYLRHQAIYKIIPEDAKLPVVYSEAGAGNGYNTGVKGRAFVDDMGRCDDAWRSDSHVVSGCAFQLGVNVESNMAEVMDCYGDYISAHPDSMIAESPNNTTIPTATQIVDSALHAWTFGSSVPMGYIILRDGQSFGGGQGNLLLYWNKQIYTRNANNEWYIATDTSWSKRSGDPRPSESPDNTEVPPSIQILDSENNVWMLGNTSAHGKIILKNGVQFAGGQGVLLLYYAKKVYTKNDIGEWYVAGISWTKVLGDPRFRKQLNIPWVGQNTSRTDDDYTNSDCGPASVCMWLRYRGVVVSVDQVSKATGLPANFKFTYASDLDKAANVYGLNLLYKQGSLSQDLMKSEIDKGRPCIALVYYPSLPVRFDTGYSQSHWIVITGYDAAGFYYNDPYWPDERGKNIPITYSQMMIAMANVSINGNTPNQGLIEELSTAVSLKSGVGVGNLYPFTDQELEAIQIGKSQSILLLTLPDYNEMRQQVQRLRAKMPGIDIVGRLFFPEDGVPYTPQHALDYCRNGLQGMYDEGIREYQVGNEPNIYPGGMGWNWNNGVTFAAWLDTMLSLLRSQFSGCKWGYPALSPQPNTESFFRDSKIVADKCDFVTAHSYWQSWSGGAYNAVDESGGMSWKVVARQTAKPLYLTEYSCNTSSVSYADKGIMYKNYLSLLKQEGRISKAFSFALSWGYQDINLEAWVVGDARNQITDIPRNIV